MENKDWNLLRPFDVGMAKRGVELFTSEFTRREYVAGPDANGYICVRSDDSTLSIRHFSGFRMAPLALVEGKPVYDGDVLYLNCAEGGVATATACADGMSFGDGLFVLWLNFNKSGEWTWIKPVRKVKKKGWVNVYVGDRIGCVFHETQNAANNAATHNRIACAPIEFEVEE